MGMLELSVDKTDTRNERRHVSAGGFFRPDGDMYRRLPQHLENMGGIEAPDAVALEQFGECRLTKARSLVGCGHTQPQIEKPFGTEIVIELEHGGKIAPELLAHAVGQPVALGSEIPGHA